MGSKLWSSDALLLTFIHPMLQAYVQHNYEEACQLLYQLNSFFVGFGVGIDDLPKPESFRFSVRDRMNPEGDFKNYYEHYAPLVKKAMGLYIAEVLRTIGQDAV